MKYLLLSILLTGCASSFKDGDCIEYFTAYHIGKPIATKPNGDNIHEMALIKEGKRKITCPR